MNQIQIAVLGDYAVGKTSIIKRYLKKDFYFSEQATIGNSFYTKLVEI